MRRLGGALAALLIGVAIALVIVGVAVALLLNPIWVGMEQERAESGLLTGYGPAELRTATNEILGDLIVGPPDFDVAVNGQPVLNERERSRMRDLRNVLAGLYGLVIGAVLVLVVAWLAARRRRALAAFWRRVARGGRALAVVVLTGGFMALLFFPGGPYIFDPSTERLVQLFPDQFWVETSLVLGVLLILIGAFVSSRAGSWARRAEQRGQGAAVLATPPAVAASLPAEPGNPPPAPGDDRPEATT